MDDVIKKDGLWKKKACSPIAKFNPGVVVVIPFHVVMISNAVDYDEVITPCKIMF